MINAMESQTDQYAKAVVGRESKFAAPSRWKSDKATSWFVPPLVVPAFPVAPVVARVAYRYF
jgi:hypothetical protein